MDWFTDPTPLERDMALHKAHLFDRNLLRFNVLMQTKTSFEGEGELIGAQLMDLKIEDLVCDESIQWPEA